MSEAETTYTTRRYRVSYRFIDEIAGDENAIRKAIRDLSFSSAFNPDDMNHWRVTRTTDGQYLLAAQRTLVDEIEEPSERAALRRFLYAMDVPDCIEVANIRIECLDDPAPGETEMPLPARAA